MVAGYIFKKTSLTGKIENDKRPGRLRSTSPVDEQKIICMVKKKTLYDCTASQEHAPGCRQTCLLFNDQEKTSGPEPQGIHLTMQTPGKHQKQTGQAAVHKTHKRKPVELLNRVLWTDETKTTICQNDGKSKVWRKKNSS